MSISRRVYLELDDASDDVLQHHLDVRTLLRVHHAVVALLQPRVDLRRTSNELAGSLGRLSIE